MVRLDDCSILQPEHLVKNILGGTHDSISIQNLRLLSFACGSSQAMSHGTKEHLAWRDLKETQVSKGSRSLNVLSGELRLYVMRPWH
jgi:hypothetical protein